MSSHPVDLSVQAWGDFCDDLKAVGAQVLAPDTPADALTRAEGFRYLTRLLRLGLEKCIEYGDPDYPQFYSLSHETAKIGNDNPAIHYHNSCWQLAPLEVLVIEFTPPARCRAWNFQLSNYWMESLDYRYHRISVNDHSAVPEPDGSIRIVVSHVERSAVAGESAGRFPNWLETAGHSNGAMLLRYVAAEDYPPVRTHVLPLSTLLATSGEKPL